MKIGITDTGNKKFDFYCTWLHRVAKEAEIVKLRYDAKNGKDVKQCDGIILAGGGDIHPKFYGREDQIDHAREVDVKRDQFEIKVVKDAVKAGIPILGICRGMQVFNVAMGGSMIVDVEAEGYKNHAKKDGKDRRHNIEIERNTTLHWIVESTKGEVNTAHHQAVDVIGEGLRVSAKSPDGIVEGLEWENDDSKPFMQLVQWHPERMEDFNNACSRNLLEHFVLAVASRAEE